MPTRCWPTTDPLYLDYHDTEWGRPQTGEARLLEKLCLEGFQSGLSWLTILRKRERFREVFCGFDPEAVAAFDDADVARLMADAGIVRNRAKIEATIANARAALALSKRGSSLSQVVWAIAPPANPAPATMAELPALTPESTALAKAVKRHGFRFVGPTTAYALMQACGVVNDHLAECFVREDVERERVAARRLLGQD